MGFEGDYCVDLLYRSWYNLVPVVCYSVTEYPIPSSILKDLDTTSGQSKQALPIIHFTCCNLEGFNQITSHHALQKGCQLEFFSLVLSISRLNDRWTSSVVLTSVVRLTSNVRGLVVGSKLVQHIQCEIGLGSCSRSVSRTYNGISGSFYPADNRFSLVYCLFYMYALV